MQLKENMNVAYWEPLKYPMPQFKWMCFYSVEKQKIVVGYVVSRDRILNADSQRSCNIFDFDYYCELPEFPEHGDKK